ncbi:MAG: 50S ribosome-binding GTPase [Verrucomicrobia bacterium]|nr:50S ribosome-binding GTPase [Cytophagales bacterium]
MDILRIATAGSVDDGKSTLIGRLLYETQSVTQDKLEAIEKASQRKGLGFVDLSLLTDGLIAEREQGITIDVAHIYFSTPTRKFIIADTPGHFEYTRNMVTGASNAMVSLILVDARHGVMEQTHRHFYIASLLQIPYVIVCINKMDLVNYSENRFNEIVADFDEVIKKTVYKEQNILHIPISSLFGENITKKSEEMPWYTGESLLETLERTPPQFMGKGRVRFPVQSVTRPMSEGFLDFRGYAGKVASGVLSVGDAITVLPTGQTSKIKTIEKFGEKLAKAFAKESVVLTLEDNIDISRGNMLVRTGEEPQVLKEFTARICWLDHQVLTAGKTYLLQHGINRVKAKIQQIESVINVQTLEETEDNQQLSLNQIGVLKIRTAQPIFADKYTENPANGAFILIDEFSNGTVGVGFVQ